MTSQRAKRRNSRTTRAKAPAASGVTSNDSTEPQTKPAAGTAETAAAAAEALSTTTVKPADDGIIFKICTPVSSESDVVTAPPLTATPKKPDSMAAEALTTTTVKPADDGVPSKTCTPVSSDSGVVTAPRPTATPKKPDSMAAEALTTTTVKPAEDSSDSGVVTAPPPTATPKKPDSMAAEALSTTTVKPADDGVPSKICTPVSSDSCVVTAPSPTATPKKPDSMDIPAATDSTEENTAIASQPPTVGSTPQPTLVTIQKDEDKLNHEPEDHKDGDLLDTTVRKLKGARPELFRASAYYAGAKNMYVTLAGLPVVKSLAPTVEYVAENVAESIMNVVTPLKPSPEQQVEHSSIAVLDTKIRQTLLYADEKVDETKDKLIEGAVCAKKVISALGPVQTAVEWACSVGDDLGQAYNDHTGQTVQQTFDGAWDACTTTVGNVTSASSDAVSELKIIIDDAITFVQCTVDSAVSGVKSAAGNTANTIAAGLSWATSTAMWAVISASAIPICFAQSVFGWHDRGGESSPGE